MTDIEDKAATYAMCESKKFPEPTEAVADALQAAYLAGAADAIGTRSVSPGYENEKILEILFTLADDLWRHTPDEVLQRKLNYVRKRVADLQQRMTEEK